MIFLTGLHYSYMELELISKSVVSMSKNYYIIPIWNWSKNSSTIESTLELLHYSYMELELFLLKELKEF